MRLLLDIGRLTIGYRSDMEGTAIRWEGTKHCWRLTWADRSCEELLPREDHFLDHVTRRRPNDWGGEDVERSWGAGDMAVRWERWRVPDPMKAAERKRCRNQQWRGLADAA